MDSPTHAIVLAAGQGSRLTPLTDVVPKPLLPIDGVPVIERVLDQLAGVGVTTATVVLGHLGSILRAHLEQAAPQHPRWPELAWAEQHPRGGSAHALQCALEQGSPRASAYVVASDTWWRDEDVQALAERCRERQPMVTMGLRRWPVEQLPHRSLCTVDEDLRVLAVLEKPGKDALAAGSGLSGSPIYAFSAAFWPYVEAVTDSSAGIRELAIALQRTIDDGHEVAGAEVRDTRDLTRPQDLLRHNFPYLEAIVPELPTP